MERIATDANSFADLRTGLIARVDKAAMLKTIFPDRQVGVAARSQEL